MSDAPNARPRGWLALAAASAVAAAVLPLVSPQHLGESALVSLVFAAAATLGLPPARRARVIAAVLAVHLLAIALSGAMLLVVAALGALLAFGAALLVVLAQGSDRALAEAAVQRADAERHHELAQRMADVVALEPAETIDRLIDALRACGFPLASVGELVDGHVHEIATSGLPDGRHMRAIRADEGLVGQAVLRRRTVYVEDYQRCEWRTPAAAVVIGAAMAAPILVDDVVVGVLLGARPTPGPIADEERSFFEALAMQAGRALGISRRFHYQQQLAGQLADLDHLKRSFLESVSTDLRGPLTIVRGLAHTLREHVGALDEDEARTLLQRLNANGDRLNRMIEALLDFSRATSGGGSRLVELAMGSVVDEIVADAAATYPTHRVTAVLSGGCEVLGDPDLLRQAVLHLVDNACRHTDPGTSVVVAAQERAGRMELTVHDDGVGLSSTILGAIHGDRLADLPGTLGLTLVDHILVAHGSRLRAGEPPGTHLGFDLPVVRVGLRARMLESSRRRP